MYIICPIYCAKVWPSSVTQYSNQLSLYPPSLYLLYIKAVQKAKRQSPSHLLADPAISSSRSTPPSVEAYVDKRRLIGRGKVGGSPSSSPALSYSGNSRISAGGDAASSASVSSWVVSLPWCTEASGLWIGLSGISSSSNDFSSTCLEISETWSPGRWIGQH